MAQKRIVRQLTDACSKQRFARELSTGNLPYTCKRHQSLLRRKLGSTDPKLQENKIVNVKIALAAIDGLVIKPGETFSFWKRVGKTTAEKGYLEGLLLSQGEVKTGIGGGICQLANLLFWLGLHTPLQVIERHHHQFDPFPDDHRVLPFGSGASVFYNYVDLRFFNPTDQAFQIRLWVTENHLKGAIFSDRHWPFSYHLEERNHSFLKHEGKNYRKNEIWRSVIDKRKGSKITEELLIRNVSEVKYELDDLRVDNR